MKRLISFLLCLSMVFGMIGTATYAEAAEIIEDNLFSAAASLEQFYEAHVVLQMGLRGAAVNPNSKGIAFEIMASDLMNLVSPGTVTTLSESMTDQVADLVTKNCAGETINLVQCKTGGASYVSKVLSDVSGGKYSEAELLTTSEFAEKFNVKAEELGISQQATDSHVKESTVEKICSEYTLGEDALYSAEVQASLFANAIQYSGYAAITTAALTTAESIIKGYSLEDAAVHVTEESTISAVSVGFGTMTAGEISLVLAALGAPATVTTLASGALILLVPVGAGYALHVIAEKTDFEGKLRNIVSYLEEQAVDFGASFDDAYGTFCSNCGADLPSQEGYDPRLGIWACTECGMLMTSSNVYDGERFPGVVWFCDGCNACLSKQHGFTDLNDTWVCTKCGYVNPITDDDEWADTFDNSTINEKISIGSRIGYAVGTVAFGIESGVKKVGSFISGIFSKDDGQTAQLDFTKATCKTLDKEGIIYTYYGMDEEGTTEYLDIIFTGDNMPEIDFWIECNSTYNCFYIACYELLEYDEADSLEVIDLCNYLNDSSFFARFLCDEEANEVYADVLAYSPTKCSGEVLLNTIYEMVYSIDSFYPDLATYAK